MSVQNLTVTGEDVIAAGKRIRDLVQWTPVMTSRLFDEASGVRAYFKCENLQRGGSFKIRGAANFLMSMSEADRQRGVVAFSSGNHGQAVAIAAAHFKVPATIVMPLDAPKAKLSAVKSYGAKIVLFDRHTENREEIASRLAAENGATVVPPYDHPWIIAGQGTMTSELLDEVPHLDALVICLGGGGLLSGALAVTKERYPYMPVIGVEPELANDWHLSLKRGERVEIPAPPTIADGLRTQIPGKLTFSMVSASSARVVLVSEAEIKATVRYLLSHLKVLTEPSGAAAAAAVLHHKLPVSVQSVGIVLSGGNVDMDALAAICGEAA